MLGFYNHTIILDDSIAEELDDNNYDLEAAFSNSKGIVKFFLGIRLLLELLISSADISSGLGFILFEKITIT